ncbi:MAG TPA: RNA 2',3'-cyclic phosphodiesterase [Candidatus Dormibacteraeota bacterium]|nr:RNA 2',3'-cyclic phosphodiesterase [Candidatus Dormibacteraeota bacterium]
MNAADEKWRLFVAISVPPEVKEAIGDVQKELRRELRDGAFRWTVPAQLHLTLRFLGSVRQEQVSDLVQTLEKLCRRLEPMRLRAEGLGVFPNERRPRVVWAGVRTLEGDLSTLQRKIQEETLKFTNEPPEESFRVHLTLGRAKVCRTSDIRVLGELMKRFTHVEMGEWRASQVQLIRSYLSPSGSRHETITRAGLGSW